ncbi:MAG: UDP-N-acetylmuramoyl-tripeptide--D-alanyl-D-alanine ligase, partial [Phaeodactylibacter sp.]|nr:UDP-N-acetylmuramoyl-tripeptide--D-alanyl-D-alanine ligase [Phaeodactylibacter sp.]
MTSIDKLYQIFLSGKGVATDSRKIGGGELFIALKGDLFDGNQYADQALEKGANYVVVDDPAV